MECGKCNPIKIMHKDKTGTDFNEMKQFMRHTGGLRMVIDKSHHQIVDISYSTL